MTIRSAFSIGLTLALSFSTATADDLFTNLRNDRSIPSQCAEMTGDFFQEKPETFTFGAAGATQRGFDYSYDLSRNGANLLWHYFNNRASRRTIEDAARNEPQLLQQLAFMEKNRHPMDFSFGSEGEVLEIFAMKKMHEIYPSSQYYITGSVSYHHHDGGRLIGELDIIVGRRSNCTVVAVGEAKLGKRLGKAKQQLQRFIGFYNSVIRKRN